MEAGGSNNGVFSQDSNNETHRQATRTTSLDSYYNGISFSRAEYRTHGSSFGNRFVISLPILNAVIPIVFLISSYLYALNNTVPYLPTNQDVPFISDIGNEKPQSSLFTFGMSLSAYFTLGTVLVRFCQIQHFLVKLDGLVNYISLVAGLLFILGKIMVVSFQISSQKSAHFVGAGLYVIFATAYAVMQTVISYKNKTLYGRYKNHLIIVRIVFVIGMLVGTLLFGIFLFPNLIKYNRKGYSVSQSGEWLFASCKLCFMFTFVLDFWSLHPRLLLIKPNREGSADMVLSNMNNGNNVSLQSIHGAAKKHEEKNGQSQLKAIVE